MQLLMIMCVFMVCVARSLLRTVVHARFIVTMVVRMSAGCSCVYLRVGACHHDRASACDHGLRMAMLPLVLRCLLERLPAVVIVVMNMFAPTVLFIAVRVTLPLSGRMYAPRYDT